MKVHKLRKLLSPAERPALAFHFFRHPNFEKNLSKLWPGPTRGPQFVCGGHLYYLCLKSCTRGLSNFIFIFEII